MPLTDLESLQTAMLQTDFKNYADFLTYYIAKETNSGESFSDFEDEMRSNPIFKSYADFFLFKIAQVDFSAGGGGGGSSSFIQAGTGAVSRTLQNKGRESFSVEDFGAVGNGVTNDTAAIIAAIAHVNSIGGGSIVFSKPSYFISDTIVYYSNMSLEGNGCTFIMSDNSKSIFKPSAATFTSRVNIYNFTLNYQSRTASATPLPAISLGQANTTSYFINIHNVTINDANTGIGLLSAASSFAFYISLENVFVYRPKNYGIILQGDPTAGTGTNYNINGFWVIGNDDFSDTAEAGLFNGITGLYINNFSVEKLSARSLIFATCDGFIGNIYIENCRLFSYVNTRGFLTFSNCLLNIGCIIFRLNNIYTQGGNTALLKFDTGFDACTNTIQSILNYQTTENLTTGLHYELHLDTSADQLGQQGQIIHCNQYKGIEPTVFDNTPIFSPFGVYSFNSKVLRNYGNSKSLSSGQSLTAKGGIIYKGIVISGTAGNTINLGTTVSGSEILDGEILDSNGLFILSGIFAYNVDTLIYISGNVNNATVILSL